MKRDGETGRDLLKIGTKIPTGLKKERWQFQPARRETVLRVGLLAITAVILAIFIIPRQVRYPIHLMVGQIADQNIQADKDYSIVDPETTLLKKNEVAQKIGKSYDYYIDRHNNLKSRIANLFNRGRSIVSPRSKKNDLPQKEELLAIVHEWGFDFSESILADLVNHHFSKSLEERTIALIGKALNGMVIERKEAILSQPEKVVKVRFVKSGQIVEERTLRPPDFSAIVDVEIMREQIAIWTDEAMGQNRAASREIELSGKLAKLILSPNLIFNADLTNREYENAMNSVDDVTIQVKSGEVILRKGDRVRALHLILLKGIEVQSPHENYFERWLSLFILVFFFLALLHTFAQRLSDRYNPTLKDLLVMSSLLILILILINMTRFVGNSLSESFPTIPLTAYRYLVPTFAGVMLLRLVFSTEIPLFFSIALSLILGISLELNSPVSESALYYALYNLLGNVFAISSVAKVNLRGSLLKIGTFLGLANTLLVTFILFVQYGYQIFGYPREIFFSLLFTFLGGSLSGFAVVGLMPIIESFGYVTDIKFLELANTNHPLLTRLAIEAPGTSHHSFIVSRIAEAAAEAISGNALYARVASLYHDIGKTFKPDYFVENQKSGENKHDHIAPRMSSLIIQAHVKDGIELAKKYKLPQSIIDAIPQHHGTSLITYFYSKAKKLENPQMERVEENDYRYPGPKPKSRECAVIMLADATEAATRSLDEPTPTKISGVVDMIIHKFFSDGQLTQCELTLTDLNTIGESFVKVLSTSIYHQRVKYPGQKERTLRSASHSS